MFLCKLKLDSDFKLRIENNVKDSIRELFKSVSHRLLVETGVNQLNLNQDLWPHGFMCNLMLNFSNDDYILRCCYALLFL